jgi:hypothetical protein
LKKSLSLLRKQLQGFTDAATAGLKFLLDTVISGINFYRPGRTCAKIDMAEN